MPRGKCPRTELDDGGPWWKMVNVFAKRLRFPILVKPPHGYASVGITRDCHAVRSGGNSKSAGWTRDRNGLVERCLIRRSLKAASSPVSFGENPDECENPIQPSKPVGIFFPKGEIVSSITD